MFAEEDEEVLAEEDIATRGKLRQMGRDGKRGNTVKRYVWISATGNKNARSGKVRKSELETLFKWSDHSVWSSLVRMS